MHALNQRAEIGNKLVEGFGQRFAPSEKHIVMTRAKVTRASCRSRSQAPFYAVAFGGIADFLCDGEANAGVRRSHGHDLQAKSRPPGASAPGSLQKLRSSG
jgi:hypothetical protein